MQLLISMISKNISKGHLSFTLPRQRPLRHRGLGMVFFLQVCRQFSPWAPVLVARSLFPFFFSERIYCGNFECYKENAFTSNSYR